MKQLFLCTLIFPLCLWFASCSAISRTWHYTSLSEGWTKTGHQSCSMAYSSKFSSDTITLTVHPMGPYTLIIGPVLMPIFLPRFLAIWAKEELPLEVDATFNMHQPYTIDPRSIHFIDSEGKDMFPYMIERSDSDNKRSIIKMDSTIQGIMENERIRLHWRFKGKQTKVKCFSISIDPTLIPGKSKPLVIQFRRKTTYQYFPWIIH